MEFPLTHDITREVKEFEILSDMSLIDLVDFDMSSALKSAGWKDGQWVKTSGTTKTELSPTDSTPVKNSFCVWTGSSKTTDPTTDTFATGKLTLVSSSGWLARTKLFNGTPAIGTLLVAKSGILYASTSTAESLAAVGVVTGPIVDGYLPFRAI